LAFLTETAGLPEQIEEASRKLEAEGKLEYAAEMAGIWDVVVGIFDQMRTALGDRTMSMEEYATVLRTGFESVKMGILPPSSDRIVLGTMQRTRSGRARAVFVLGANDGILPAYTGDETILSSDEKLKLENIEIKIGRNDDNMQMEEQLAIYRNLSKAERLLFVGYSVSDASGKDVGPSIIFERLRKLFPGTPVEKDILNIDTTPLELIYSKEETINHLTAGLRKWAQEEVLPEVWRAVYLWLKDNMPERAAMIESGLTFTNRKEKIDEKYIASLYASVRNINKTSAADGANAVVLTSPSALEQFSRCPFTYFLDKGLKLKERRVFAPDSRSIGDVYHEVLMEYANVMNMDGVPVTDPASRWHGVTKEETERQIGRIFDSVADKYKEGMFTAGGYERYKSMRMKSVVSEVAWVVTEQVRSGNVQDMYLETGFGAGKKFPAILVERAGKTVQIRGQIDRVDVLDGGYANIIDYKSGAQEFKLKDVLAGWQLQLMIYLKAVSGDFEPAGVFYFKIKEPHIKVSDKDPGSAELQDQFLKQFKLDGIAIDDARVAAGVGLKIDTKDKNEFDEIRDTVNDLIEGLCERLLSGAIDVNPMEAKEMKGSDNRAQTACTYCNYSGICNFDGVFE
jgi:ATP-dependent helicase/nuclease subunit B